MWHRDLWGYEGQRAVGNESGQNELRSVRRMQVMPMDNGFRHCPRVLPGGNVFKYS